MSADKPGFLSRWSRRKLEARHDPALDEKVEPAQPVAPEDPPVAATTADQPAAAQAATTATPGTPPEEKPLPTLEDVAALTADSDFSLFVAKGVAPEVKNAAMKKLFSDPHYNIMDGLDIYIDDYSQQEVMPQSMLRKMVGARVLNLFTDEDEAKAVADDERLAALATPGHAAPPAQLAQAAAIPLAEGSGDAGPAADIPPADAVHSAAEPAAPGTAPDDRPARTMLESADSPDPSAPRGVLTVPMKPGS